MTPIQQVLSRIRWDPGFGRGEFVLGYYDRIEDRILRVPLSEVHFDPDDHFACRILDAQGTAHLVPLHRIREVFRDGVLIWQRHPPH
jgi:uncharacterized protein (UPF0248 family)